MQHTWEESEIYTKIWSKRLKGRDFLDDLGIEGRIILNSILNKWTGWLWVEFIRLRKTSRAMNSPIL
jgi:hypothetical protein